MEPISDDERLCAIVQQGEIAVKVMRIPFRFASLPDRFGTAKNPVRIRGTQAVEQSRDPLFVHNDIVISPEDIVSPCRGDCRIASSRQPRRGFKNPPDWQPTGERLDDPIRLVCALVVYHDESPRPPHRPSDLPQPPPCTPPPPSR